MCNMEKNQNNVKEKAVINEEEELESEDDEEEEMDENIGKVVNVAFDARPPSDSDFHGVKRLLQQLFVKNVNEELSELANLIVAQDFVGSVLKQDFGDDDEDESEEESDDDDDMNQVYAVHTAVNLSENQNLSCIEKINELLTSRCMSSYKQEPSRMANLLGSPGKQVGLLIAERFINIPPQVALPSYQSLKSDIEKAVRKKKKFNFSHLVLISKTYRAKGGDASASEMFYTNPEEQLFEDMCEFSFTFSVADQRDSVTDGQWDDEGSDMESLRTVMVFNGGVLSQIVDKLTLEVPAS